MGMKKDVEHFLQSEFLYDVEVTIEVIATCLDESIE